MMSKKKGKTPGPSNVIPLITPEKTSSNDKALKESNLSQHGSSVSYINRVYDQEHILSELIKLSFLPMEDFLYQTAKLITSIKWLNLQPSCAIFLTRNEGQGRVMKMVCNYNLDAEISSQCAHIIFGECLCGRTAVNKRIKYTADINKVDNFHSPSNKRQAAYTIPILQEDKVLGVIALYLRLEHKQQPYEVGFLNSISKIVAIGVSRRLAEQESERLTSHNALTSLPNRSLLIKHIQTLITEANGSFLSSALIYINIDRFSKINDFFGYSAGDSVLVEITQRLRSAARNEGMLAHLEGDEFAIVVNNSITQDKSILEINQSLIKKLNYFLSNDFIL
ncbi:MAG: diguanylate cyclase, partial [Methyloprofundus sp.]|nr:diguanylate cyclase [Methyloprofundus sp.]